MSPINPRTRADALAWLDEQTQRDAQSWLRLCDNLQAQAYGWAHSGAETAHAHWLSIPRSGRVAKRNLQAGDLAFWAAPNGGPGHVLSVATGSGISGYSNDVARPGRADLVLLSWVESRWGFRFLGFTLPIFPNGNGRSQLAPATEKWPEIRLRELLLDARTGANSRAVTTVQAALVEVGALKADPAENGWWSPSTRTAFHRFGHDLGRKSPANVPRGLATRAEANKFVIAQ